MWQTHNIQFANFDVASLRVIWVWFGRAFGLPIRAASHVEKAFSGCESRAGK